MLEANTGGESLEVSGSEKLGREYSEVDGLAGAEPGLAPTERDASRQ